MDSVIDSVVGLIFSTLLLQEKRKRLRMMRLLFIMIRLVEGYKVT
jgi:hypothetical protein